MAGGHVCGGRGRRGGEILLLLALIAATAGSFAFHRRLAAALLLPYLAWCAYAAALAFAVWRMNPGRL